ncbi:MAG: hypothetical protein EXQ60_07500 [Candidatus Nanopelagicales bacterium]|nr:hypothetical protein [Candidatus Nanopelagicales bacterium]
MLLMWGGTFAHSTVTNELSGQKISFAADPASLTPELAQYAWIAVTEGTGAKAYSDLTGVHVAGIADGKTYSEVSEEWIAKGRTDDALAGARTTLFMGETRRGMLGLSLVMFILTIMGFMHLRKTTEADAVFVPAA